MLGGLSSANAPSSSYIRKRLPACTVAPFRRGARPRRADRATDKPGKAAWAVRRYLGRPGVRELMRGFPPFIYPSILPCQVGRSLRTRFLASPGPRVGRGGQVPCRNILDGNFKCNRVLRPAGGAGPFFPGQVKGPGADPSLAPLAHSNYAIFVNGVQFKHNDPLHYRLHVILVVAPAQPGKAPTKRSISLILVST